jgi:hypothetical protein
MQHNILLHKTFEKQLSGYVDRSRSNSGANRSYGRNPRKVKYQNTGGNKRRLGSTLEGKLLIMQGNCRSQTGSPQIDVVCYAVTEKGKLINGKIYVINRGSSQNPSDVLETSKLDEKIQTIDNLVFGDCKGYFIQRDDGYRVRSPDFEVIVTSCPFWKMADELCRVFCSYPDLVWDPCIEETGFFLKRILNHGKLPTRSINLADRRL